MNLNKKYNKSERRKGLIVFIDALGTKSVWNREDPLNVNGNLKVHHIGGVKMHQ
jgi:hypothetical protein